MPGRCCHLDRTARDRGAATADACQCCDRSPGEVREGSHGTNCAGADGELRPGRRCSPWCGESLFGVARNGRLPDVGALSRFAMSPRVRGSGSAVDRVRLHQNIGAFLMASAALERQRAGLDAWSANRAACQHYLRGCTAMWDEASQRLQALMGADNARFVSERGRAQTAVQVMVVLASVAECRVGLVGGGAEEQWQC